MKHDNEDIGKIKAFKNDIPKRMVTDPLTWRYNACS